MNKLLRWVLPISLVILPITLAASQPYEKYIDVHIQARDAYLNKPDLPSVYIHGYLSRSDSLNAKSAISHLTDCLTNSQYPHNGYLRDFEQVELSHLQGLGLTVEVYGYQEEKAVIHPSHHSFECQLGPFHFGEYPYKDCFGNPAIHSGLYFGFNF